MNIVALRTLTEGVRSKLFIPGSRPELFSNALAGQADALSFDLEDSVLPSRKAEARASVAQFLRGTGVGNKLCIVRVNALTSPFFADDIAMVVVPGLHILNLPKIEGRDDVLTAVGQIERAEQNNSMEGLVCILANIETPKGLRLAHEIATAHPRVVGLQIGFVDLSLSCGIEGSNTTALNAVRLAVRFAASEAGIAALDGAYADVQDLEGFRASTEKARDLGITGKSCVHPVQVPVANEIFSPDAEAVRHAAAVIAAAESAKEEGTGAFLLDGKMIDAPIAARAQLVLGRAQRYGIPQGEMESRT